jgi:hypothetical protein
VAGLPLLEASKSSNAEFKNREQRLLVHNSTQLSHLQNDLFAQTLPYAQNFILGISIICLW